MKSKGQKVIALAAVVAATVAVVILALHGGRMAYAATAREEKIIVSLCNDPGTWLDDTLYTLNPDGSDQTALFDFHSHLKDPNGRIFSPRIAPDGNTIVFHSDNAYLFTPADRNIFVIPSDGARWDQITPGPNSGKWNEPCPCGTVEGTVTRSDGTPWSGAPVFLEGMDMIYSGADGSFRYENVPEGLRWIVAYKPGDTPFEAQTVLVLAGATYSVHLVPDSDWRMSYEYPVTYGDRIYYRIAPHKIQRSDINRSNYTDVYAVTLDSCSMTPGVDGFDVAPVTGRIAIIDYQEGCGAGSVEHQGVYVVDKDGNNRQLLVDMIGSGAAWCNMVVPQGIFWSPDESRLALTWCYDWDTYLLVYDSSNGGLLGYGYWEGLSYAVNLHGWSPDGNWLLYSHYDQPAQASLTKIGVNGDGSLDFASVTDILTNAPIVGATWGEIETAPCARPLTAVTISGPTSGTPGTSYSFVAHPQPDDATSPLFEWSTTGLVQGQGTTTATYSWTTEGAQTVSVTATNCGGAQSASHTITIAADALHRIYLPFVTRR